jgi:peroxiredoxin
MRDRADDPRGIFLNQSRELDDMRKKYFLLISIVFLVISTANAVPAAGQFFFMEDTLVGKQAPDFTLKMVGGDAKNFTKHRAGKKAIIFFWATWCPHCRVALSDLNKEQAAIAQKGIVLFSVNSGETQPVVQKYLTDKKVSLPVFLDEDSTLAEPYGLAGVPTFIFVDERGVVKGSEHELPKDLDSIFK